MAGSWSTSSMLKPRALLYAGCSGRAASRVRVVRPQQDVAAARLGSATARPKSSSSFAEMTLSASSASNVIPAMMSDPAPFAGVPAKRQRQGDVTPCHFNV